MTDTALDRCDAYVARTAGPPGRAQVRALADRNRFLEAAHDDAGRRERAALACVGDLQVELEATYAEVCRLREAHEAAVVLADNRLADLAACRAGHVILRRQNQQLQTAAQMADELLAQRMAPPACVSLLDIWCVFALAALGGWLARG